MEEIYSGKRYLERVREFGKYNRVSKGILKKKIRKEQIRKVQMRKQKLLNPEAEVLKRSELPGKCTAKILFR